MNRQKIALEKVLYALADYKENIEAIYLYGSYARGTYKYNSDVDLLIKVNSNVSNAWIRQLKADVMQDDIELPEVDLKIVRNKIVGRQFAENFRKDAKLLWKKK
ncbi:MAG: nucleotidyltransferase domain-containing protein [Lachnospiraceae bacterium]|nr:nucleotidyltransferase domain-containing protein [Lachnospiraceae bacterium]